MAKRAAIYMRVSTNQQEENYSFDDQADKTRAYCGTQDYQVVMEERDVHTGFELDEREGLSRIREAVLHRKVDVLVVVHLDRLSRNQTHQEVLFYECCRRDIEIEAVEGEKFDVTPIGRHIRHTLGFVAEMERQDIVRRTTGGRRKRAERGENMPGYKAPYGYRFTDATKKQLMIDPETAPIVERIFQQAIEGVPTREIARRLNSEGYLSPREQWLRETGRPLAGHIWGVNMVVWIIHNPTYTGHHLAYRNKVQKIKRYDETTGTYRKIPRVVQDNDAAIEQIGVAPAIVSEETALAAQRRFLVTKAHATRNRKHAEEAFLRDFAFCGHCGRRLFVATNAYRHKSNPEKVTRTVRYSCPHYEFHHRLTSPNNDIGKCIGTSIGAHRLEPYVWYYVCEALTKKDLVAKQLQEMVLNNAVQVSTNTTLELHLKDLERQQRILASILATIDDPDAQQPIMEKLRQLSQQRKAAQVEIGTRQEIQSHQDLYRQRLLGLQAWLDAMKPNLEALSADEKRLILYGFKVRVYVWRKPHHPHTRLQFGNESDLVIIDVNNLAQWTPVPLESLVVYEPSQQMPEDGATDCDPKTRKFWMI